MPTKPAKTTPRESADSELLHRLGVYAQLRAYADTAALSNGERSRVGVLLKWAMRDVDDAVALGIDVRRAEAAEE